MKTSLPIAIAWILGASLASVEAQPPAPGSAPDASAKPVVYIDTDVAAEVDDSYAVYRALIAPEFDVVGLSAIGWEGPLDFPTNTRSSQKMNEELLALLGMSDRVSHPIGAMHPMPGPDEPVDSPAARDIIAKAKAAPPGRKLQVFVLGAYTNVASALLLDPTVKDRMTVHVMGFRYDDGRLTTNESNTQGDLHAAAALLKSGVELKAMVNTTLRHFQWSKAVIDSHFKGKGGVRDFLVKRWEVYCPADPERTLWDIAVFEAVLRPELATLTEITHEGARLHIWSAVDVPGMMADFWRAAERLTPETPKPRAAAEGGSAKPIVYVDTDMGNEVDDPYAVYRALIAPEFEVVGLSSAGWGEPRDFEANTRTSQKMNEEVLALLGMSDRVAHPLGATRPMPGPDEPVDSLAARDIILKARAAPPGRKLQVFALGAYTNVASALLLDPAVKDRMAVHVMGFRFDDGRLAPSEFNTQGDLHAAAVLLKSGVELNVMPNSTTENFRWSKADVDSHFKGGGGVRDYLVKRWETHAPRDAERVIWDVAVFEAVLRPELTTRSEVVHEGSRVGVWTRIDGDGMKADYWRATQADPIVISRGGAAGRYQAFPDACRLKNGDILAAFYAGYTHVSWPSDEFPLGGRLCVVRSSDEGRTWSEPAVLFDDKDDNRDPHLAQLDDGSVVCAFFSLARKEGGEDHAESGVQIVVSRDDGRTWEADARVIIPDWVCSAPVRQLADGTCVLGLYRGDPATGLSIAGTTRSMDRGRTWEAPVAIKAPPGVGLNAETDVIPLADGRLYAAMRSFTDDMYQAISEDGAKTWSEASKAGFPAHAPHLTRLSDGRIILSHRLPQTSIHVSDDDAKTWRGSFAIDSCIGAYPATVELKDGSVLIVYYTEGGGSAIRARRFRLGPEGVEFLPF